MKIKQILVAFLFTTLVISCGNKAKDIDISELTTECDLVDAMVIVLDEAIALGEAVNSEEGASEEQKKEYESLGEKSNEIEEQSGELGFKESDLKDCPKWETLKKKTNIASKLENILR